MKVASQILSSLILSLTLGAQLAPAVSPQQDEELRFKTAINRHGWELPGLRRSRVEKRKPWGSSQDTGKSTVFLSILKPRGGSLLLEQRAHYYAQKDGTLLVEPVGIRTGSIMRYDVAGKPFCYVYFGGGVRILMTANGRKLFVPLGCSGGVAYYDEDGDGVFERLDTLLGTIGFKPHIPPCVKQYVLATPDTHARRG